MRYLKPVFRAENETKTLYELATLKDKWSNKYPMVIGFWKSNWPKLSNYFKYLECLRNLINTTNTIEGYHREIRKNTKKGILQVMELLKVIYLATERTEGQIDNAT
jgi:transposase-like protein